MNLRSNNDELELYEESDEEITKFKEESKIKKNLIIKSEICNKFGGKSKKISTFTFNNDPIDMTNLDWYDISNGNFGNVKLNLIDNDH